MRKKIYQILFITIFILLYFSYISYFYATPNNYSIFSVSLIGFALLIISFFLFTNLNYNKGNEIVFQFRSLSENSIKFIFMIFMSIAIFISPISSPKAIILWEKVSLLNYIRAFIFLIGAAFLPGANLYYLIFPEKNLHEKFNVEPFLLKAALYPLISFAVLGITVLVLDQIGVNREFFDLFLYMTIIMLGFLDFTIQIIRKDNIKNLTEKIDLSKYTLIILLISLGVLFISLAVHLGTLYLIPGDAWLGNTATYFVGNSKVSPLDRGSQFVYYPIFWGYILTGLSALSGLPYINTNALLAPFCYIFVISIYLLMKSILLELKEIYSVLSTILMSMFSGFSYYFINLEKASVSTLVYLCEFAFFYKTYAYYLFFIALSLFIISTKTSHDVNNYKLKNFYLKELRPIILVSFFLVISFMVYMIPLQVGIIFIIIYCIFSDNKKQNLKILSLFLLLILIFFISLDILIGFYLSSSIFYMVKAFTQIELLGQIPNFIPINILIYGAFSVIFFLSLIFQLINAKYFEEGHQIFLTSRINYTKVFKIFYILFTCLLIVEITIFLLEESSNNTNLINKFIIFFYLSKIFSGFGLIGILAVYLSHYSFNKNKRIFAILISWIIVILLVASALIFFRWIESSSLFLNDIDEIKIFRMEHWFGRNSIYSIIPFSALSSIGIIDFSIYIKNHRKFKTTLTKKSIQNFLKFSSFSLLIYLSLTGTVITVSEISKKENRIHDDEIQIIGWMSENLPIDSKILLYDFDYILQLGIKSTFSPYIYYIDKIFKSDYNYTELINEIEELRENKIKYLLLSKDYLEESSEEVLFVKYYLKPNFYNESLHETGDYKLYYAPYFD